MSSVASLPPKGLARPQRAIMDLLKNHGPSSAQDLARSLEVSAMAVRQHLYAMQDQKLVAFEETITGVGRPSKEWRLTEDAAQFFPDAHAELATSLLDGIRRSFGAEGLDKIVTIRSREQIKVYKGRLDGLKTLAAKVKALASLRTSEGYMAEASKMKGNRWLLIENHCPVCSAAQVCAGLCQAELSVFRAALGRGVTVERSEHMLKGSRRCVYEIIQRRNP